MIKLDRQMGTSGDQVFINMRVSTFAIQPWYASEYAIVELRRLISIQYTDLSVCGADSIKTGPGLVWWADKESLLTLFHKFSYPASS